MKKFLSTIEAGEILGISRVAVFNRIKSGEIKARKIGRNYAIPSEQITGGNGEMTDKERGMVEVAVDKTIKEYGETLKLLGNE